MKKILILLTILLVACQPSTEIIQKAVTQTQTEVVTGLPQPTETLRNILIQNTKVKPYTSPTPKSTPTPVLLLPAPAGVIYQTDTELWQIQEERKPHLIYQFSKGNKVYLSPDNTHLFYYDYSSSNQYNLTQYIVDLSTLSKTLIFPLDNLNICRFTWMPGQSDFVWTVLLPDGADPGYSCERGSPVFLSIDGSNLNVLDDEGFGSSSPSVSPNGKFAAFEKRGEPWLYEWGKSALPFDTNLYNLEQSDNTYFLSPTWSPDSNLLAWIKVQKTQDSEQREIIIFDLRNDTYTNLSPCNDENNLTCGLFEFEGEPKIAWSGDGSYLSLINYSLDFFGIYSLDGIQERVFDHLFSDFDWNPTNSWYARIEKTKICYEVFVESSDGEESHQAGCGKEIKWSPDGSQLIFGEKELGWWLLDLKTWIVNQIDLPQGII